MWFTLRTYGIEGLQQYIRNHCQLAKEFEKLVISDDRFEVVNDVRLGLVCFRLRGNDLLNQDLLALINSTGRLHMIPSKVKGNYAIRFAVCYEKATKAHIGKIKKLKFELELIGCLEYAWREIQHQATKTLEASKYGKKPIPTPEIRPPHGKLARRFSFTRSVSRDVYERRLSRNSLQDGATPITVPEDEDLAIENGLEDVFEQNLHVDSRN